MPATDSSSNGGAPSTRAAAGGRDATIEGLTVAVGQLRRGVAALKAENRELRAEIARLEREATGRRDGDAPIRELATDSLPGDREPGRRRRLTDGAGVVR